MIVRFAATALAFALLAGCSSEQPKGENADDFAARVGGAQPAGSVATAPAPSGERATAAQGAIVEPPVKPGSTEYALAPGGEACDAPAAKAFIGQPDTPQNRLALTHAAANAREVRFLPPGSADKVGGQKGRLNAMVDTTGIIRDLRCG